MGVCDPTQVSKDFKVGSSRSIYDEYSYGSNGGKCLLTTCYDNYGEKWNEGDIITTTLEFVNGEGTLSFAKNGVEQGMAFEGLVGPLFPMVCLDYRTHETAKVSIISESNFK